MFGLQRSAPEQTNALWVFPLIAGLLPAVAATATLWLSMTLATVPA